MATLIPKDNGDFSLQRLAIDLPRLRWTQILAISVLAFASNFHWAALGIIILPSQVASLVGNLNKGTALAFILAPGAFVALFANPLFGWLSDRMHGRLAAWGRRRPFILVGTLVNVGSLIWMANAHDLPTLLLGYILVQFSSNAALAPFHALLPDMVLPDQRGLTSGTLGLLGISGYIGGVIVAGLLVDSSKPLPIYLQGVRLAYGIMMAIMIILMLVTILSVRERKPVPEQAIASGEVQCEKRRKIQTRRPWLTRSSLINLTGTAFALALAWGLMTVWNKLHIAGFQLNGNVQQVILEMLAAIGIMRLFDFNPRRDPDFAWVFATRLIMMLGIYTIQDFLQYYMQDVVKAADPEQATTRFIILVSITSLISSFAAGWFSDHFGRKRLVYISGFMMAFVGVIFILTHSFTIIIAAGALFGLGYGAYQSVDWAMVADVLPSHKNSARDMGVWNIALSLSQVIAPELGGPIRDSFVRAGNPVLGYQVLFIIAIVYCVIGTITIRFIRGTK
jgi:MFS family permease